MNKTLKNLRNAAVGLGLLIGGSQVANAQAFPAGSAEDKLIQNVRAEVARTHDAKWGYSIEINEEPCLDLKIPTYQKACLDGQKEYTVCVRDEEWSGAIDPVNVSSKALCSTLAVKNDGSYNWFRLDGDNDTRSCMWSVEDKNDLEFMGLYNLADVNGGVNNIRLGFPGAKQSDEGIGLVENDTCQDKSEFEQAMRSIRFSFYGQADPRSISLTKTTQFNETSGAMTLEKKVYKIQPAHEPFETQADLNGHADYMGTAQLKTRMTLTDGNVAFKYEDGVLQWLDVNPETAANWYAEAGLLRSHNENGTWSKQKIDNKGWSQSPLLAPIRVDYQATDEYNDGPCGHPAQFDATLCPQGAPFTLCLQDGKISYQDTFDARVNGNTNVAHGLARVIQDSNESGRTWDFTPYNIEGDIKVVDGLTFNNSYWGFASHNTNVAESGTFTNRLTGAQVSVPMTLGELVPPYANITLFPHE